MIEYKNLTLIGTSHISPESINEVRDCIKKIQPQFVAIELDKGRFDSLMQKSQSGRLTLGAFKKLGVKGVIFSTFGAWIEHKLGKMVGTKPGNEMKGAVIEGAKIKARIILIDQEISITLKRLFKNLTWTEKIRFVLDLLKGVFGIGEKVHIDLKKVPGDELIEKLILSVKDRYPSIYQVLIEERNVFMARRLHNLIIKYPEAKIVAVVGAGHQKGIIEELQKVN